MRCITVLVVLLLCDCQAVDRVRKRGRCPPAPLYTCRVYPLPDPCSSNDFNCPGAKKCCRGGCGNSCMDPVKVLDQIKPGKCPPVSGPQCDQFPLPDPCKGNDYNCAGPDKCCPGPCGTRCVYPGYRPTPLRRKPGRCPPQRAQCTLFPLPDKCKSNDFNCPGKLKCCQGFCGSQCMKPQHDKAGQCPSPPRFMCLMANPPDTCQSNDYRCPKKQKCCRGACGKICRDPR